MPASSDGCQTPSTTILPLSKIRLTYGALDSFFRLLQTYVLANARVKNTRHKYARYGYKALQFAGKVFLGLTESALLSALQAGVLLEVNCDQTH